ncbi:MAG: phosphopantetheine-binding protein [Bacteroidota bacterium]
MNVKNKIVAILSWVANVPTENIDELTNLQDDLSLDSMDRMLLVVKMERLFGVELQNEQIERLHTVEDATHCIEQQLMLKQAAV